MDESKAGVTRRHRIASITCLEFTEGRRLLATNASQGGIRELTSNGTTELAIMGTNRGDIINIADNGSGQTGNITVSFGDGSTYTSQGAIELITVQGKRAMVSFATLSPGGWSRRRPCWLTLPPGTTLSRLSGTEPSRIPPGWISRCIEVRETTG
jgi:hypothetical protein